MSMVIGPTIHNHRSSLKKVVCSHAYKIATLEIEEPILDFLRTQASSDYWLYNKKFLHGFF